MYATLCDSCTLLGIGIWWKERKGIRKMLLVFWELSIPFREKWNSIYQKFCDVKICELEKNGALAAWRKHYLWRAIVKYHWPFLLLLRQTKNTYFYFTFISTPSLSFTSLGVGRKMTKVYHKFTVWTGGSIIEI